MRYKEIVEDRPVKQPENPRARLRAKAAAKGYDVSGKGPNAAEIIRRAEQPAERRFVLTKANRHLLRRWLSGDDNVS